MANSYGLCVRNLYRELTKNKKDLTTHLLLKFMFKIKNFYLFVTIVISLICSKSLADCDEVLKLALEQTKTESVVKLNQKTLSYYQSDQFRKDVRDKKFKIGVVVKGVPLSAGASDGQVAEWQKKIISLRTTDLSVDDRQYFFETRGLSLITDAWLKCKQGVVVIVPQIHGDSSKVDSVSVTFKLPVANGLSAEVTGIRTIGCKQISPSRTEGRMIGVGQKFNNAGISTTFLKKKGYPRPSVLLETTAGVAVAFFDPFPAPIVPPAPAEFLESTKSDSYSISAFGCWKHTGGDDEMDTDSKDHVPVSCGSRIRINSDATKAILRMKFFCREQGGNGTTFNDSKDFVIYEAPHGSTISKIGARGGLSAELNHTNVGQLWDLKSFPPADLRSTYWSSLKYRIDSRGGDDAPIVGVTGKINFVITLQVENPAYTEWQKKYLDN